MLFIALVIALFAVARPAAAENRTLSFFHVHSRESLTVTYKRNGRFDEAALKKLNYLLRDWRTQEVHTMDRRLFDLLWEVYQLSGSKAPIHIISSYRSPKTNHMLRTRSRNSGVAEHSLHMRGMALDFYLPDVPLSRIREIGMKLQGGGVGYYPSSGSPFVHLDVGNVRAWPRMTREQLVRLFPDGKTVHLPPDGKPLKGYQLAKTEIEARRARGTTVPPLTAIASARDGGRSEGNFLTALFSRDSESRAATSAGVRATAAIAAAPAPPPPPLPPSRPRVVVAALDPGAGLGDRPAGADPLGAAALDASVPLPRPAPRSFDAIAALYAHAAATPPPSALLAAAARATPNEAAEPDPSVAMTSALPPTRPMVVASLGSVLPALVERPKPSAGPAVPSTGLAPRAPLHYGGTDRALTMADSTRTAALARLVHPKASTGAVFALPPRLVEAHFGHQRADLRTDRFAGPAVVGLKTVAFAN